MQAIEVPFEAIKGASNVEILNVDKGVPRLDCALAKSIKILPVQRLRWNLLDREYSNACRAGFG